MIGKVLVAGGFMGAGIALMHTVGVQDVDMGPRLQPIPAPPNTTTSITVPPEPSLAPPVGPFPSTIEAPTTTPQYDPPDGYCDPGFEGGCPIDIPDLTGPTTTVTTPELAHPGVALA